MESMSVIREIIQLGHPVLRGVALPVSDPADPEIRVLVADLLATLASSQGVGIAAPQVGVGFRTIVVASRPNARYPQAPLMDPLVMHNPELLWASDGRVEGWEGCLSIPGIRGLVSRHQAIRVRYLAEDGQQRQLELDGFPARIFQHEADHLDGLVFLDRVTDNRQLITDQEYRRLVLDGNPG